VINEVMKLVLTYTSYKTTWLIVGIMDWLRSGHSEEGATTRLIAQFTDRLRNRRSEGATTTRLIVGLVEEQRQ
jgi:hypothetical protein